jgi:periplasmic protein TonB
VQALLLGCLITSTLFVSLPLTQLVSEQRSDAEVRTFTVYQAPPPPPEIEPPPKEEEKTIKEEDLELRKEFQKLNLSTIDMALNVGSGGSGSGIYVAAFEIDDSELNLNFAFEISDLDAPPIPILQIAPAYPPTMKRAGIGGTVTAEFVVTSEGRVVRIKVLSATSAEFIQPVLDAVRRWKFEPGMKDEKKVNTRVRVPFNFRLDQA